MTNRTIPAMAEAKLAFLKKLVFDHAANSLVRKLALLDLSHLGRPALEPLLDFVESNGNGCPVRGYAIEMLREFNRRHGSHSLNEDEKRKIANVLEKSVAVEGLARGALDR